MEPMPKKRDNFSPATKRSLADRVAWKCSYPNCNVVTIGPSQKSTKSVTRLGDAAHIHAAAEKGPRFDLHMSEEARKSIDNGIWMCTHHARLIDYEDKEFSADTLRKWKFEAENTAYAALKLPGSLPRQDSSTLIQLGKNIVFFGKWTAANSTEEWIFEVVCYVYGDEYQLKEYCSTFDNEAFKEKEKYFVIQSQGDGRWLNGAPAWKIVDGKFYLTVFVQSKSVRQDPHCTGTTFAFNLYGSYSPPLAAKVSISKNRYPAACGGEFHWRYHY
jgi:hypothetical protein